MTDGACETPIEELRKMALEHDDKLATKEMHWMTAIPHAINYYYDHLQEQKKPKDPPQSQEKEDKFLCADSIHKDIMDKAYARGLEDERKRIVEIISNQKELEDDHISEVIYKKDLLKAIEEKQ